MTPRPYALAYPVAVAAGLYCGVFSLGLAYMARAWLFGAMWPFIILSLAVPPVAISLTVTVFVCARIAARIRRGANGFPDGRGSTGGGVQAVPSVHQSVFAFDAPDATDHTRQYYANLVLFGVLADAVGFPHRRMAAYVSRVGWDTYTDTLLAIPAIEKTTRGFVWLPGWSRHHLRMVVYHNPGSIRFPCPTDRPAPKVDWPPNWRAAHTTRTGRTVIVSPSGAVYRGAAE